MPEKRGVAPVEVVETDVLIVGGGVAGCLAALGAREAGARVAVCDKGGLIERSGSVGAGVDHFLAVLESGPEWDTPEFLLRHIPALTEGIVDLDATRPLVFGLPEMFRRLQALGVDFRDPLTGGLHRHRAFGLPGEYHVNFDGRDFKHIIGRAARNAGARVLERVMVAELLRARGRAAGAVAFHIRRGTCYLIRSRAVVAATGDTNRLSRNASGNPFDSWHCPYNTGDAQAMGLRAGAHLANMEFTESTVSPKGYSCQGLNAFTGGGAHLMNARGERFMFRYHPSGERARRSDLVNGVATEILAGRGPIHCDCRHLPEEEIRRLEETLGVDRPALPSFFAQKKIDLRREPFEVTVTELSSRRGGVYFRGSGLLIDAGCRTSLPGLFAAGDCSTVSAGISGACVMGYLAGREAAGEALMTPSPLPEGEEETLARLMAPLRRGGGGGGLDPRAFEDEVRRVVTECAGYRRDEARLARGLRELRELAGREGELAARDFHGLMRAHEARNIRAVAEALALSALERRESRGAASHVRIDYPERDDARWRKLILVRREGGRLAASFRPLDGPGGPGAGPAAEGHPCPS